jgi:hypothetical protein
MEPLKVLPQRTGDVNRKRCRMHSRPAEHLADRESRGSSLRSQIEEVRSDQIDNPGWIRNGANGHQESTLKKQPWALNLRSHSLDKLRQIITTGALHVYEIQLESCSSMRPAWRSAVGDRDRSISQSAAARSRQPRSHGPRRPARTRATLHLGSERLSDAAVPSSWAPSSPVMLLVLFYPSWPHSLQD